LNKKKRRRTKLRFERIWRSKRYPWKKGEKRERPAFGFFLAGSGKKESNLNRTEQEKKKKKTGKGLKRRDGQNKGGSAGGRRNHK